MPARFPLDTVLKVRENAELREERVLSQILAQISETRRSLDRIDIDLAGTFAARQSEIEQPLLASHLHSSYARRALLQQARTDLVLRISQWIDLRDRQMSIYQAARRDREMITDLREQHRTNQQRELARKEQSALDEIFLARRGRK